MAVREAGGLFDVSHMGEITCTGPNALANLNPIRQDWFDREDFASWDWLYDRKIPFNMERNRRFSWGEVLIHLEVSEGMIRQVGIWTDALEAGWPGQVEQALTGVNCRRHELEAVLEPLFLNQASMARELVSCIIREEADGETI